LEEEEFGEKEKNDSKNPMNGKGLFHQSLI